MKSIIEFSLKNVVKLPPSLVLISGGWYDPKKLASVAAISPEAINISLPVSWSPLMFIHNGRILLCGGENNLQFCLQLDKKSWKDHSILQQKRSWASVATTNTATFLFGGDESKDTYEYLGTDSIKWQVGKNKLPNGFSGGSAIAISQNEIWLIGGAGSYRRILSFDIRSQTFKELPMKLEWGRRVHRCIQIPKSSKVIITGGEDCANNELDSTEIIDIETGIIKHAAAMNFKRSYHGIGILTLENIERVVVFGGFGNGYTNSIEAFDPERETWDIIDVSLIQSRSSFGYLTVRKDNIMYLD